MGSRRITFHETAGWDGTRLHYEVSGQTDPSAPVVILNNGIGCAGYVWRYIRPVLETEFKVVHWHYRAHGHSGESPDPAHYTIDDCVKDCARVMDASGADNALLIGHSMGVQVSLEAALCYPKRINGLALLCGSHSRPLDTFQGTDRFRAFLTPIQQWVSQHSRSAHRLMETLVPTLPAWWVAQGEVDGRMMPREDFAPYLEHLAQMNPAIFLRMLESAAAHTTEDRLCDISVPVLVVGGEKDGFTPFEVSERMAKCLPKGELYKIRGGSHTAPLEQPQLMELVLDDWLRRHDFMAKPKTPVRKAVRSRRRSPGRVKKPGS